MNVCGLLFFQGSYSDKQGLGECTLCPISTFNPRVGANNIYSCEECEGARMGATVCATDPIIGGGTGSLNSGSSASTLQTVMLTLGGAIASGIIATAFWYCRNLRDRKRQRHEKNPFAEVLRHRLKLYAVKSFYADVGYAYISFVNKISRRINHQVLLKSLFFTLLTINKF